MFIGTRVQGQGPVATVIAKRGTLRTGQSIVVGNEWGKVRFFGSFRSQHRRHQADRSWILTSAAWRSARHDHMKLSWLHRQAKAAHACSGQVRALRAPHGGPLKEVLPGQPAEIIGLRGMPQAGDSLMVRCRRRQTDDIVSIPS